MVATMVDSDGINHLLHTVNERALAHEQGEQGPDADDPAGFGNDARMLG